MTFPFQCGSRIRSTSISRLPSLRAGTESIDANLPFPLRRRRVYSDIASRSSSLHYLFELLRAAAISSNLGMPVERTFSETTTMISHNSIKRAVQGSSKQGFFGRCAESTQRGVSADCVSKGVTPSWRKTSFEALRQDLSAGCSCREKGLPEFAEAYRTRAN